MKWLFLFHQIRTPDSRVRVKVWRLTKKCGALLYRNSAYVLPHSRERLEEFQWLCQQIRDAKGEASVFVSEADTPEEEGHLKNLFVRSRGSDFESLRNRVSNLSARIARSIGQPPLTDQQRKRLRKEFVRLQAEYDDLLRIDFFPNDASAGLRRLFHQAEKKLESHKSRAGGSPSPIHHSVERFQNKIWATREHIHIDRLCSAWLIKRFIDPKARFIFAPEGSMPAHAIPFDLFGAEFSHHADDCTFETLLKAFSLRDRSLASLAEIVHDIDIKDRKFGRPEAPGIDTVVRALSGFLQDDSRTLKAGTLILDSLHHHLSTSKKKGRRLP